MSALVNIDGVWVNPAAIDKVESFTEAGSRNANTRIVFRSGETQVFGVTVERLLQLLRDRPKVEFPG